MEISSRLPQFRAHRALLIVAGKQEAKLYLAHGGAINCVAAFRIPTPRYSDREGFSMRRGGMAGGFTMGVGGGYDDYRDKIHEEFLRTLEHNLHDVICVEMPTQVYLYAPARMKESIVALLPASLASSLRWHEGMYVSFHPFKLLAMVP